MVRHEVPTHTGSVGYTHPHFSTSGILSNTSHCATASAGGTDGGTVAANRRARNFLAFLALPKGESLKVVRWFVGSPL